MLLGKTANVYGIINVIEITGTFYACLMSLFKPYLYLYAIKLILTSRVYCSKERIFFHREEGGSGGARNRSKRQTNLEFSQP